MAKTNRALKACLVLGTQVILVGCASMTHFNLQREDKIEAGEVEATFIDAKQRAFFFSSRSVLNKDQTENQNRGERIPIVCAEPSPDALSALAASQSFGFDQRGSSLDQAFSLAESAGSIGLRTQSIQLMRDSLYRACEMYLNQGLSGAAWQVYYGRSQNDLVTILAIEQLTGAVSAAPIVLAGNASTGDAEELAKLTQDAGKAQSDLVAAEQRLRQARTDRDRTQGLAQAAKTLSDADSSNVKNTNDAATTEATAKTAAEELVKAESDVERLSDLYRTIEHSRQALTTGITRASSSGRLGQLVQNSRINDESVQLLAKSVENIHRNAITERYSTALCTKILSRGDAFNTVPNAGSALALCLALLNFVPSAGGGGETPASTTAGR